MNHVLFILLTLFLNENSLVVLSVHSFDTKMPRQDFNYEGMGGFEHPEQEPTDNVT